MNHEYQEASRIARKFKAIISCSTKDGETTMTATAPPGKLWGVSGEQTLSVSYVRKTREDAIEVLCDDMWQGLL